MFFTDLHELAIKMPNGRRFVTDLLHKVWDLIDAEAEGIDEEDFNSSALTHCYKLSANDCIKEDPNELVTFHEGSGLFTP